MKSCVTRPWELRKDFSKAADDRDLDLVDHFLRARGLTDFDPYARVDFTKLRSPFLILNMEAAAQRLAHAIEQSESIALYADYDMDGMSGLSILSCFLKDLGVTHQKVQPDRLDEGYGVHRRWIEKLSLDGVRVLVTIDTGSSAHDAIERAQELKMDVIVTDHHLVGDPLPPTRYLCNPNQAADRSGLGMLSGAGMSFYLAMATRKVLRDRGFFLNREAPDLLRYLDFFALGTIADLVPLENENQILLRAALERLRHSQRPGIVTLLGQCLGNFEIPSVRDIAFSVTPKLNAASRMGKPEVAMKLLLSDSASEALDALSEVIALNQERSELQKVIFQEAYKQAVVQEDDDILVVHGPWHEGVLGIIAAKLVESFSKPAIVLSSQHGVARGSMRTVPGAHCVELLEKARDLLLRFGGHEMAAGLSLETAHIPRFRDRLSELRIQNTLKTDPIIFDAWIDRAPTLSEVEKLYRAGPFGVGNPEPLFGLGWIPKDAFERLGKTHIKFKWNSQCHILGFGFADNLDSMDGTHVDVLVTPEINRFRNSKSVQLRICELRSSQSQNLSRGPGRGFPNSRRTSLNQTGLRG